MIFGHGLRIFTDLRTTDCDFLNGQPFDVGLIGLARHISTGFCALGAFFRPAGPVHINGLARLTVLFWSPLPCRAGHVNLNVLGVF